MHPPAGSPEAWLTLIRRTTSDRPGSHDGIRHRHDHPLQDSPDSASFRPLTLSRIFFAAGLTVLFHQGFT